MKTIKFSLILAIAAAVCFGLAGTGYAFHDGGVATCEGCHTMHNSLNGAPMAGSRNTPDNGNSTAQYVGQAYLLQGSDPSSTCLNCHMGTGGSYQVATKLATFNTASLPAQMGPGGDFTWLKVGAKASAGWRRGHNIVANDYVGYVADTGAGKDNFAPGGAFLNANLGCSSCHDPHGKYRRQDDNATFATTGAPIIGSGSYISSENPSGTGHAVGAYRILGGAGYTPKSGGGISFTAKPPVVVVDSSYNRAEYSTSGPHSYETRVAYGSGMSEWCSNCHTQIHQDSYTSGNSGQQHPAGDGAKLTAAIVTNYNAYVSSGIAAAGNHYTSLVPFEDGSTTFSTLQSRWADTAPATQAAFAAATTSNVMCLSCHKAHASGFYSMLRYPTTDLLTDEAGAYELIDGLSATQMQRAFNERPASVFGVAQRSLCNKCHAKD